MQSLDQEAVRFSADIRRLLSGYPHCLVIRELDPDLGRALLTGLASALGRLVLHADRPGYRVIRELRPRLERATEAGRALNELLHTDGTDEPRPNDLTCLFCF